MEQYQRLEVTVIDAVAREHIYLKASKLRVKQYIVLWEVNARIYEVTCALLQLQNFYMSTSFMSNSLISKK